MVLFGVYKEAKRVENSHLVFLEPHAKKQAPSQGLALFVASFI